MQPVAIIPTDFKQSLQHTLANSLHSRYHNRHGAAVQPELDRTQLQTLSENFLKLRLVTEEPLSGDAQLQPGC